MANEVLYGFHEIEDLDLPVTTVGTRVLDDAVDAAVAQYNSNVNTMLEAFAVRTDNYKTVFKYGGQARLQPLDDNGRARKVRAGLKYDISLPIFTAGAAWGANWKTLQKMTARDVNNAMATLTIADMRWVRDLILSALFTNTEYVFDDEEHGELTVSSLANGDAIQYPIGDYTTIDTDTHYLAQNAAIADAANPFPALKAEIDEHPENTGDVIFLIPANLEASVTALSTFIPMNDANVNVPDATTLTRTVDFPVGKLIGYVQDGGFVFVWKGLPSNYIIATSTGAPKPLAMREETLESLRGFLKMGEREDVPFWEAQYVRYAGFGGWNRTAAAVMLIGAVSYAIPTGYAAPLR